MFNEVMQRNEILVMTVDGVHFRIHEVRLEPNANWYSFKHRGPGLTYELGVAIWEDKIIWINGPFRASTNDISMFTTESGLQETIPEGKKALGDGIYNSAKLQGKVATKDHMDTAVVKDFKNRAVACHENMNFRIKVFRRMGE